MRQRNIKDIESKLASYSHLLVNHPEEKRGQWRALFAGRDVDAGCPRVDASCPRVDAGCPRVDTGSHEAGDGDLQLAYGNDLRAEVANDRLSQDESGTRERKALYLELGCGKGRFIIDAASRDSNGLYMGFEGQPSILWRALAKADAGGPPNALFCCVYVLDMDLYFEEAELSGVYLNFSDPWPKARHEKRRLTSYDYLKGYHRAIEPEGFLSFKTDNDDFFAYSRAELETFPGFEVVECTDDLHRSAYAHGNIMTEYERKYLNLNKRIKYILARRR